ncbi:MAG: SPASM domain-containing protein [Rhodopseudomonas palustris]|nr:SPASM domain-containing protein [Rhodopseudomonas palustris]
MIAIFDEWVRRDVGQVFVQTFDATLASFIGQHSLCIFSPTCGNAVCLEHNGDLYSCDHYVEPGYLLGNIKRKPMYDLAASKQQQEFGRAKLASLPKYCRECQVLSLAMASVRATALLRHPTAKKASTICAKVTSFSSPMSKGP